MVARSKLARQAAEKAKGARWRLGDAYEPALRVQDVPSSGRKSRLKYHGREMQLLSDLEVRAVRHFEWEESVFDIEDQYCLEVDDTVRIADKAGARHPLDIRTGQPFGMSTDLVIHYKIDRDERRMARSIKCSKDLELGLAETPAERRKVAGTLEKLEIERRYWAERHVHWALLTERELTEVRTRNIELLINFKLNSDRRDGFWQITVDRVCSALMAGDGARVVDLQRELNSEWLLEQADFTACLTYLCATRQLVFDMEKKFSLLRPVSDFAFCRGPAVAI